jgi:hypothetical protein
MVCLVLRCKGALWLGTGLDPSWTGSEVSGSGETGGEPRPRASPAGGVRWIISQSQRDGRAPSAPLGMMAQSNVYSCVCLPEGRVFIIQAGGESCCGPGRPGAVTDREGDSSPFGNPRGTLPLPRRLDRRHLLFCAESRVRLVCGNVS